MQIEKAVALDTAGSQQDLNDRIERMWIISEKESNQQLQTDLADGPTLEHMEMPWEVSVVTVDQYNKMFIDRMQKLAPRVGLKGCKSIEQIQSNSGVIQIVGMVKRVEFKRVRAFEKHYQHYYETVEAIYEPRDTLELEDPTGKVIFKLGTNVTHNGKLVRPIDLPYGVVVGLKGKFNDYQHHFEASQIFFPELPPQRLFQPPTQISKSKFILICEPTYNELEELLERESKRSLTLVQSQVEGVIIVGYSPGFSAQDIKKADELYLKHSKWLYIYIMPAQNSKFLLPLRPYHSILYPKSRYSAFLCSNPQIFCNPNCLEMLVMDGRSLRDLIKNCAMFSTQVQALAGMVTFSHLAPTAPFSLKCSIMPEDHLILNSLPHIMIAVSCDKFEATNFEASNKKVRLVTVPRGKSIIVDENTLEVSQYTWNKPITSSLSLDIEKPMRD